MYAYEIKIGPYLPLLILNKKMKSISQYVINCIHFNEIFILYNINFTKCMSLYMDVSPRIIYRHNYIYI